MIPVLSAPEKEVNKQQNTWSILTAPRQCRTKSEEWYFHCIFSLPLFSSSTAPIFLPKAVTQCPNPAAESLKVREDFCSYLTTQNISFSDYLLFFFSSVLQETILLFTWVVPLPQSSFLEWETCASYSFSKALSVHARHEFRNPDSWGTHQTEIMFCCSLMCNHLLILKYNTHANQLFPL